MGLFSKRREPKVLVPITDPGVFAPIIALWNMQHYCGYSEPEVAKLLGMWGTMPPILLSYYRLLGAHKELNQTFCHLMEPSNASPVLETQDYEYLVFFVEEQGVYYWGIRLDEMATDEDPPVYVTEGPQNEGEPETWLLESAHLSEFLNTMAHFSAAYALPSRR